MTALLMTQSKPIPSHRQTVAQNAKLNKNNEPFSTATPPFKITVFDATSKLQSGIISGNLYELGHYDQCVSIENEGVRQLVNGKYCLGSAAMLNGSDLLSTLLRVAANISKTVSEPITEQNQNLNLDLQLALIVLR